MVTRRGGESVRTFHKGWGHTGGYYKRGGFHCKSKNEVLSELECGC